MPEPAQNNEQSMVPFIPQGYLPIDGLEDPFTENILPRLFNDLPSLLRLSRVCRAFYHLIHQPSLLEKLFQHYALNPPTSLSLAAFGDDFLNTSLILPSYLRCASDTTAQTLNSPAPHNLIMKLFAAAVSQDPALLITLLQSKAANDLLHELKLDRVSFLLEIHPVETKKSPLSILQNNLPGSRETLDALYDFSGQTHRALLTCRRFDLLKAIMTNALKTGLSFTALELGDIAALTAVLEEVQRRWSGEQKDLAADDESRGVQAIRPHFSNISLLGGAISLDDLKSIALLVNTFRVSVNKDFDKVEMSPLHVACSKTMALKPSSPEVVALLLALGAAVNAQRNNDNATPLHCAVACGDALSQKRIQVLLEAGAKVDAQDNQGRTPLHLYILSQGAWHNKAKAWDDNDRTILCNLIEAGKQQGISQDKLMNMTDSQGDNALHYIAASTQLSEQIAVDLLELGVNPSTCNAQGHSPLHLLCVRNEPRAGIFLKQIKTVCGDVADYLCGCRDQSGGTILHFILMQILKHQFFQNIFSELFSVLSPREIQRFVNIKNHQDRTAFHAILIELSSVTEEERTTKLSSFELSLKKEVLAQLIQADEEGNTLFHQLAATNDISSLQTLDRFLTHYKEHTRGDELVLSPFMQANNEGHTPQDIARNEGHTEFLSLLQDEGFAKPQYEKDALARSKAWQERVTQEKQQREAEITKRKEEEQRRSEAIARQKEEEQRYAEERDRQTRLQALNEAKVQIDTGIDRLTPHLTNLKSKIADLTHRKVNKLFGTYSGVANDITEIVTNIDSLMTNWKRDVPPTQDPTNHIITLREQSAAVLEKLKNSALWHQVNQHRGLRIALLNIAILIAGVVLISLIALAIRQKITSSASFFVNPSHPTDTANKVSAVKTTLESIQFLAQSAVPTPAHVPNV